MVLLKTRRFIFVGAHKSPSVLIYVDQSRPIAIITSINMYLNGIWDLDLIVYPLVVQIDACQMRPVLFAITETNRSLH